MPIEPRGSDLVEGAWTPCDFCQDFWCLVHEKHVHDCECPSIETWIAAEKWPYQSIAKKG